MEYSNIINFIIQVSLRIAVLANITRWLIVCSDLAEIKTKAMEKKNIVIGFLVTTSITLTTTGIYFFNLEEPAFLAEFAFIFHMYIITMLPLLMYFIIYRKLKASFLARLPQDPSRRDIKVINDALKTTRYFFIIICQY
jgi:hypothetical protein